LADINLSLSLTSRDELLQLVFCFSRSEGNSRAENRRLNKLNDPQVPVE